LDCEQARRGVEQLVAAGYVEDVSPPGSVEVSDHERERYSRGRDLFRWMDLTPRDSSWHAQVRLRQAKVIVVGLGGTGSTTALALVMSGVGRLHCVEPDIVELSNLNRQVLYTEADLGQPKLSVALTRLRRYNSDITITGERTRVTGADKLADLADGYDLLVISADEPATIRTWANRASLKTRVPWVHGGYAGPQMTVGCYIPGAGPCYECVRLSSRGCEDTVAAEWASSSGAPFRGGNAVSAGITGLMVAHAAISQLTGIPALRTNCSLGFSLIRPDHTIVWSADGPRADCPACAGLS
jgi:molybdopterin-synthase adenylyltransferase